MSFAFTNDAGVPRIIRYVDHGTLPSLHMLALYDEPSNLLIIDRAHYERITETERHMLLRTQKEKVEIFYSSNKLPSTTM
jgi:hypothetical protein